MKNLTCLMIIIFISLSLSAQDKKITIIGDHLTIKEVFEQIEAQSKFTIAYNQTRFDVDKKINVSIKNSTIENALNTILKNSGFTYKIKENHIIIKEVEEAKSSKRSITTKLTQTIRGVIRDGASGQPIPYAMVVLLNTNPTIGCHTDSLGRFDFKKVPIGRYDIEATAMGYEPAILKEILLVSSKESYNEIMLKERVLKIDDIVVKPNINKEQTLNQMVLTGGRMLSVEEANRFAGGFDDPARLVSSFAGVAGNFGTNSISVHGNAPQSLQWRLEGIEISNPTHFADMTGLGGGIFTALSSQVMGNSDFFNGAFPAEYSNALSGVFDMSMRVGNNQNYEHALQLGVLGIDFASEGPIGKKNGSSYIINYRYSTTGLISALVEDMNLKYQDLSFKLNFPTRKAGIFSVWGTGLIDVNHIKALDESKWTSNIDKQNIKSDWMKAAAGISHKIFVGEDAYIKSTLATTYADSKQSVDMINKDKIFQPVTYISNQDLNIVFNSYYNKKYSANHTNRTGVTVTGLLYNLDFNISPTFVPISPMNKIVMGNGSSSIISLFSNSLINLTDRLSTNIGLSSQFFTLNNNLSIEPRVSLKYVLAPSHTLAIAYGLHSRREKLDYYYVKSSDKESKLTNKDLAFTKANHFILSYNWRLSENINLRIEPYYQSLFDVPVEDGTSFSIINHDINYLDKTLISKGKGENYGLDITLERYLNNGYYWLLTGSVFSSKYKGGDGIWRDTKYNRKFIINTLIGKEWSCGPNKQNILNVNIKLAYQGGDHHTPINETASKEQNDVIFDTTRAFSEQFSPTLKSDLTIGYQVNKKNASHEFSLKVLNVTGSPEQHGYFYNEVLERVERVEIKVIVPNISYKISF